MPSSNHPPPIRAIAALAGVAMVLAGCGDDGSDGWQAPRGMRAAATSTAPTTTSSSAVSSTVATTPPTTDPDAEADTTTTTTTAAPTTTSTTTTTAAPAPPPPPRRVLVIGDSAAAGMRWTEGASDALLGAEFTLDLESCRRLVARSCSGREGYRPSTALGALQSHAGEGHDTLIVATGYNDHDDGFAAALNRIVATASEQGIGTIMWTTYREDVGYDLPDGAASSYAWMNETLRLHAASGFHPDFHVLDWWQYSAGADHWFEGDGVHFTDAGSYGFADLISRAVASLDGRPCPVPWAPGEAPADPCPVPYNLPHERGGVPPVLELYA